MMVGIFDVWELSIVIIVLLFDLNKICFLYYLWSNNFVVMIIGNSFL